MSENNIQAPLGAARNLNPNKPISLKEFLSGKTQQEVELIQQAIEVNEKEITYRLRHCCRYCDKELSAEELITMTLNDWVTTCADHRKYAHMFNVEMVQEILARGEDPLNPLLYKTRFSKDIHNELLDSSGSS
jgi:hypothetical protein